MNFSSKFLVSLVLTFSSFSAMAESLAKPLITCTAYNVSGQGEAKEMTRYAELGHNDVAEVDFFALNFKLRLAASYVNMAGTMNYQLNLKGNLQDQPVQRSQVVAAYEQGSSVGISAIQEFYSADNRPLLIVHCSLKAQ